MKRLSSNLVPVLSSSRVKTLEAKAGTTPRTRGRAWQGKRRDVMLKHQFRCVVCGFISLRNEVDHIIPLERGGADDDKNLQLLCSDCHKEKTSAEASERAQGGGAG